MCSAAGSTSSTSSRRAGRTRGSSSTPSVEGSRSATSSGCRSRTARAGPQCGSRCCQSPSTSSRGPEDRRAATAPPTHPVGEGRPALLGGSTGTTLALAQHSGRQLAVDPVAQHAAERAGASPLEDPGGDEDTTGQVACAHVEGVVAVGERQWTNRRAGAQHEPSLGPGTPVDPASRRRGPPDQWSHGGQRAPECGSVLDDLRRHAVPRPPADTRPRRSPSRGARPTAP